MTINKKMSMCIVLMLFPIVAFAQVTPTPGAIQIGSFASLLGCDAGTVIYRTAQRARFPVLIVILRTTLAATFAIFGVLLIGSDVAWGQQQTGDVIHVEVYRPHMDPVLIREVSIDDSKVIPGRGFIGPNDWLKKIHIVVVNKTIKTITAMDVFLTFFQTGTGYRVCRCCHTKLSLEIKRRKS